MTTELNILSSANGASVQSNDKSGQTAAQLLSGVVVAETGGEATKNAIYGAPQLQTLQSTKDIEEQVQNLQEFSQLQGWTVSFSIEKSLGQVVIRVIDADTRAVIRQIPSEELLDIYKRFQALRQGDAGANPKRGLLLNHEI
ncbi:flagellar protein FlaG [Aeromonas cavernicola]|uniref:Flagellin n=1 Tax=Aeromonas cavernicola TaxID=1006623 RepID=A0A2H9U177_9GAMM|nr:flagellar protein FlaG [Aeromonas cavernicola]PJG57805.1 flagellin [Aeromonas cavernicola]